MTATENLWHDPGVKIPNKSKGRGKSHNNKANLRILKKTLKNDLISITGLGEYVTQTDFLGGEWIKTSLHQEGLSTTFWRPMNSGVMKILDSREFQG